MKVKLFAKKDLSGGIPCGCLTDEYEAKFVEDSGDHYCIVVNEHYEMIVAKENYRIEID